MTPAQAAEFERQLAETTGKLAGRMDALRAERDAALRAADALAAVVRELAPDHPALNRASRLGAPQLRVVR